MTIFVELGTQLPIHVIAGRPEELPGPSVVYAQLFDEAYSFDRTMSGLEVREALTRRGDIANNELMVNMLSAGGWWNSRSLCNPDWVWSNDVDFQRIVAEYFHCKEGRPEDVEDVYWTNSGPPKNQN